MKKNILFAFIGGLLLLAACDPIEKRNSLTPAISEGELDNTISITVNGNVVTCSTTSNSIVFWQTSSGKQSNQKTVDFYMPLAGTYQVSCTAFGGDDKVTVTKDAIIAENDPAYYSNPMWELLTNNAEGKTWVWATDSPNLPIWGIGPYLIASRGEWWGQNFPDLTNDKGASPSDELYFDLDKAHNFSVLMSASNAIPGSGNGTFDMSLDPEDVVLKEDGSGEIWSYGKITFTNHTIPVGIEPNTSGQPIHYVYDILKLTEDELILAFGEPGAGAWGGAWFWQFKRKGYVYK